MAEKLTLATLGKLEPGDPQLKGYDPYHPWYYKEGGKPLPPVEIGSDYFAGLWDAKYQADYGSYRRSLSAQREKAERNWRKEIEVYQTILAGEKPWGEESDLAEDLAAAHNHIAHYRGLVNSIDNELALLDSRLYSQCAIELAIRAWAGKKVDQYHFERGHIGRLYGGGKQEIHLCATQKAIKEPETARLLEELEKSGWDFKVFEVEIKGAMHPRIYLTVPLILKATNPPPSTAEPPWTDTYGPKINRPIKPAEKQKSLF